jgi:hypothetical protein
VCILKRKPERKDVCYKPIMETKQLQINKKTNETKGLRMPVFALNLPMV